MPESSPLPEHSTFPSQLPALGLPIAAVERELGLGKDTLRAWEKRYGFPQPLRGESGDRLYPSDQIERLKMILRLLDAGHRPGKVVGLNKLSLQALMERGASKSPAPQNSQASSIEALLTLIESHDVAGLRRGLAHAQLTLGLSTFVTDLVAPLTSAVGHAWAQGRFEIFEEHLYTEAIGTTLRFAIASLPAQSPHQGPNVLLTTLPKEPHGIGLLMAQALLSLEGCNCISLGTQTPVTDIAQAARAHKIDVVALSFSNVNSASIVLPSLSELRSLLAPATALWAGGSCKALHQKALPGISCIQQLSELPAWVQQWREQRTSQELSPHVL
jgi:MerR family transcriptional regulator, light-induced transcriptional regulator